MASRVTAFGHLHRIKRSYKEAVLALNELQTPGGIMKKIVQSGREQAYPQYFQKALQYTKSVGLEAKDFNSLNIIHISGTKGKGSTGAFCENILRKCGLKTGFFSSPHLVELRERIVIDGRPLSKDKFAKHFWDCYGMVDAKKDMLDGEFPGCFGFLTIMAFVAFLKEKVDVAIMEVGVGGEYDPTNVIRKPVVCGITNLEYDHVEVLGETLSKIAWHKAGIFKPGRPAYTVPQKDEALQMIKQRAADIGVSSLGIVPQWKDYSFSEHIDMGIPGVHQGLNASLALQLCHRWMIEKEYCKEQMIKPLENMCAVVPDVFKNGIEKCRWPGRQQVVYSGEHVTYYLDGAHTKKSAEACSDWFKSAAKGEAMKSHSSEAIRVLLFNMTGVREPLSTLEPLQSCNFDFALFCPNITDPDLSAIEDIDNLATNNEEVMKENVSRCATNEHCWKTLDSGSQTMQFSCVRHTMDWISNKGQEGVHLQVLVCGSFRLIGAVMWNLKLSADNLYSQN